MQFDDYRIFIHTGVASLDGRHAEWSESRSNHGVTLQAVFFQQPCQQVHFSGLVFRLAFATELTMDGDHPSQAPTISLTDERTTIEWSGDPHLKAVAPTRAVPFFW